jgi:hypothetical protein
MESTELDIEFNFYYNNGGQQQWNMKQH